MHPRALITLLTDFGWQDGYIGAMKGVIFSICPGARIVDLTHDVPPQNIDAAAFLLQAHSRFFPAGTIHVAVVDPGVGGERGIVLARDARYMYLAPDNGLLTFLADRPDASFYLASDPSFWLTEVSQTFHGRDIFAPLAAHLASGTPIEKMFRPVARIVTRPESRARMEKNRIVGKVIYIDRFGNLITNISRELAGKRRIAQVHLGEGISVPLVSSYDSVHSGTPLAIWGSFGYLEIAVNQGSAKRMFERELEKPVTVDIQ